MGTIAEKFRLLADLLPEEVDYDKIRQIVREELTDVLKNFKYVQTTTITKEDLPEETLRAIEEIKEEQKADKLRLKFRKTPVATVTVIEDEQEAAE